MQDIYVYYYTDVLILLPPVLTLSLSLPPASPYRDQGQVPLCLVGLVRRAPDPHGSASHVSISGTCSSVWRTRDLPVAPISFTRAFSNRLDVREEEERGEGWKGSVWRDQPLPPQREHKRLLGMKRRRAGTWHISRSFR